MHAHLRRCRSTGDELYIAYAQPAGSMDEEMITDVMQHGYPLCPNASPAAHAAALRNPGALRLRLPGLQTCAASCLGSCGSSAVPGQCSTMMPSLPVV